jgi:hypothetical protein
MERTHQLFIVESEGHFTPKIPYTSSKNPEKIRTNPENPTDFLFKNPLKNPLKNPRIFKNPKIPYASSKNPEKIRTNPENPNKSGKSNRFSLQKSAKKSAKSAKKSADF